MIKLRLIRVYNASGELIASYSVPAQGSVEHQLSKLTMPQDVERIVVDEYEELKNGH